MDSLLVECGQGNAKAFRRLYPLIAPTVYQWLLVVVGDPAVAEKLAGLVLVDVWRRAPSYRDDDLSEIDWVMSHAYERALEYRAAAGHRTSSSRCVATTPSGSNTQPLAVTAMQILPQDQIVVLGMAICCGFTHVRITKATHASGASVAFWVSDGLRTLAPLSPTAPDSNLMPRSGTAVAASTPIDRVP